MLGLTAGLLVLFAVLPLSTAALDPDATGIGCDGPPTPVAAAEGGPEWRIGPEHAALTEALAAYDALRDYLGHDLWNTYDRIQDGAVHGAFKVNGRRYEPWDVAAMSEDERYALADQWLEGIGAAHNVDARARMETRFDAQNAYLVEYPDIAAMVEFQLRSDEYPAGVAQFVRDTAALNAPYRQYVCALDAPVGSEAWRVAATDDRAAPVAAGLAFDSAHVRSLEGRGRVAGLPATVTLAEAFEARRATIAAGTSEPRGAGEPPGPNNGPRTWAEVSGASEEPLRVAVPAGEPSTGDTATSAQIASCASFDAVEWAQSVYDADPAQYASLDPDGNGRACEELPSGAAPALWTDEIPAGAEPATLYRVVDGDTAEFVLSDGTIADVRFILIDTPETVDPNQAVACFGDEASAFTAWLLALGGQIYLERDVSDADRFGRLLRYVWLDVGGGEVYLLNEAIARSGYGQLSTFPPDVKYVEEVRAGVEFAQRHQLGLWGACAGFGVQAVDVMEVLTDHSGSATQLYSPIPTPTPVPAAPTQQPAQEASAPVAPAPAAGCHPSYPTLCLQNFPDLDCRDIGARRFSVVPPNPHGFDGVGDGVGCESG